MYIFLNNFWPDLVVHTLNPDSQQADAGVPL